MFSVYFCKFLQDVGVITPEQYNSVIETSISARVKMGLLAVTEGLMNRKQAEEVNRIQTQKDERFGDIAIEKGYLTEEQVVSLLKKQGDPYLICVQTLVEQDILTLEEIQRYINQFKKTERFSASDMDAIKSGDINKIIQIFIKDTTMPSVLKDYFELIARNFVRFIDNNIRFDRVEQINKFTSSSIASQCLDGDFQMLVNIC